MPSLFFALIASFAAAFGARDQVLVARLRDRLGPSKALLALALVSAAVTACAAAWAGARIAAILSGSAETMLVAFAVLLAGFELAWPNRERAPAEPTRSLGAIALVLAARQLTDAARFLIFAIAAATASPALCALGGAIGGGAAVAIGWGAGGDLERRLPLRAIRVALAIVLLVIGTVIAAIARGIF